MKPYSWNWITIQVFGMHACIAYEIQFDGIGVLWNQHLLDEWITYETENGGMEF